MRQRADTYVSRLERTAYAPLSNTGPRYYLLILFLLAVIGWGMYAYYIQLRYGLLATGLRDQVMWGVYIANFVFFLGIAMAGTVISAVLRLTNAGWRTPITRMAEIVTVSALLMGAVMPVIDLGRPDRVWYVLVYGRFQSAIMWDIIVITTYLVGSLIYLYLPLIPDIAQMRDRLGSEVSTFKKRTLIWLAVGWQNAQEQRHRLERGMSIMAVAIIPMAALTHTVASFIFSWMLRPGWNSTIFGIYFVIGAIFSGVATILIVMAVSRKAFHLEEYITEKHFRLLSYLLILALFLYMYLVATEFLAVGYKLEGEEREWLILLLRGEDAPLFYGFVIGGFVVPALLLTVVRGWTIPRIVTAAVLINLSMWIKRFIIVVPGLQVPMMPLEIGSYTPSWVEISITAAAFAGFVLIFAILTKLVPVMSVWEMASEAEAHVPAPPAASSLERGVRR